MKALLLSALLAVSACSHRDLSTTLSLGGGGEEEDSLLSGDIGDATVSIDP